MASRHTNAGNNVRIHLFKLFRLLQEKNIPILPFTAHSSLIADIGLPATVSAGLWNGNGFRMVVARYGDIAPALAEAHAHSPFVMIQRYAAGHAIACGVMAHGNEVSALMPVEIIPRTQGDMVPWHLSDQQIETVRNYAVQAHQAINAAPYSSVHFIVSEHDVHITDIIWAPPLIRDTLFVHSASAVGFTLPELKKELQSAYA